MISIVGCEEARVERESSTISNAFFELEKGEGKA